MTSSLFILWLVSMGTGAYVQVRYAKANYPKGRDWFLIRFGSSFVQGLTTGALILHRNAQEWQLVLGVFLCGIVLGLFGTFLFPSNMQNVIPKRDTPNDDEVSS